MTNLVLILELLVALVWSEMRMRMSPGRCQWIWVTLGGWASLVSGLASCDNNVSIHELSWQGVDCGKSTTCRDS